MRKLKGPGLFQRGKRLYWYTIIVAITLLAVLLVQPRKQVNLAETGNGSNNGITINNSQPLNSVDVAPNKANQSTVTVNSAVFPSNYLLGDSIKPSDIDLNELLTLSNKQRAEVAAGQLTMNDKLNLSAHSKCQDMVNKNYWSHYSPDGTAPWDFVKAQDYAYQKLGENLAVGFLNAQSVIQGWMRSPEHKTNLLDPTFTDAGFAVCKSNKFAGLNNLPALIIVQHLGKPLY